MHFQQATTAGNIYVWIVQGVAQRVPNCWPNNRNY